MSLCVHIHIYIHTLPCLCMSYILWVCMSICKARMYGIVSTYVYVHTYIRESIYTHMHAYIHIYVNMYVRMYIHTYSHKCILAYIYTCMHTIHTYIHTYIPCMQGSRTWRVGSSADRRCAWMYICMYTYIHKYMYTNTHSHTVCRVRGLEGWEAALIGALAGGVTGAATAPLDTREFDVFTRLVFVCVSVCMYVCTHLYLPSNQNICMGIL